MSSPSQGGSPNGHLSARSSSNSPQPENTRLSGSELSDAHDAAADPPSPSPDPEDSTAYMNGGHDFAESSDSPDENNASDDADFDMGDEIDDEPTNVQSDAAGDSRSSSNESSRPAKRKAAVEEEDFIKANPELYGLRRSVWHSLISRHSLQG